MAVALKESEESLHRLPGISILFFDPYRLV